VEDATEGRPTRARRGGASATIAWVVTLALIAGAGYGAVRYPHAVIEAWPASARLFTMLGLAP
jgi:CHASE2 domain-containing sensor protein